MLTNDEKIKLTAHAVIALELCIQSILVILKLAGVIDWGWIFVMLPLLIASVIIGLYVLLILILAVAGIFD